MPKTLAELHFWTLLLCFQKVRLFEKKYQETFWPARYYKRKSARFYSKRSRIKYLIKKNSKNSIVKICKILLKKSAILYILTLKEPGGGAESAPPRHFLLYLSRLLFFRAETSWLFSFKPCAQFKTILFLKIRPRVMTRRCVIERWVQRKTDQKLIFNGNYTQIVFFVFRIHFHYVLSYLFGLFGVRTCVSILWHTSLPKNATLLEKIAKNHDFGDLWWFSCFWHDVTVASYKVCLYFFWYQWTREGHSYPLVPHT